MTSALKLRAPTPASPPATSPAPRPPAEYHGAPLFALTEPIEPPAAALPAPPSTAPTYGLVDEALYRVARLVYVAGVLAIHWSVQLAAIGAAAAVAILGFGMIAGGR